MTEIKKKKIPKYDPLKHGRNVRLSYKGLDIIEKFCKEEGYFVGGFVEKAALDKIRELKKQKTNHE